MSDAISKELRLRERLQACERVLVAYSAGVDSTYLLAIAHAELGERAIAVTADSPSLARSALDEARAFCADRGIIHRIVASREFEDPDYISNDGRRCYHCKTALMTVMRAVAYAADADHTLMVGAITEDLGDWRPGMRAASESGAIFPLADAGLTKPEIRARSQALGLPTWNRPAEPCLSSRIPYGEPVSIEGVRMIEAAEALLRSLGFDQCRARHHRVGNHSDGTARGWMCRIEVPETEADQILAQRRIIREGLQRLGYMNITLDLAGLVSGGFNRLLARSEQT